MAFGLALLLRLITAKPDPLLVILLSRYVCGRLDTRSSVTHTPPLLTCRCFSPIWRLSVLTAAFWRLLVTFLCTVYIYIYMCVCVCVCVCVCLKITYTATGCHKSDNEHVVVSFLATLSH
jgi:hypothetical protein